ncbi:MAG TPA: DMT family transporter [Acetobacteraceae bacterium]|nr:DMT family transporter [Acetobacteraceae bacterium]
MRVSLFRLPGSARGGGVLPDARDSGMLGIGLGILAYALFSVHDATIKWLVTSLPVWEVLFVRSLVISVACVAIGRRRLLERAIASPIKGALAFRGVITLTAWICYFTAARTLPFAELLSLYFAAPLMVTVMAAPLLGEQVTSARWVSVLVGFAGVLVVTDPWGVRITVPTLLVLLAAAQWGYGVILMRQIARRESSLQQIFFINLIFLVGTGIACAFSWQTPTAGQLGLLLLVSVFGAAGQFSLFEGARLAQASVMATVEYSSLIWAFILGYAIWGNIPSTATFAGAGLILLAGALLFFGERRGTLSRRRST